MEKITPNMTPNGVTMQTDAQQFALALRTWRLRQGLTQSEVGQRFGVSRYTIMAAEGAKPISWQTAYRLFAKLSTELAAEDKL